MVEYGIVGFYSATVFILLWQRYDKGYYIYGGIYAYTLCNSSHSSCNGSCNN